MKIEDRLHFFPDKIRNLLVGEATELSFEARIYNSVNIITIICLMIMTVGNYIFQLYGAMMVTLLMACMQMVLYYYARVKKILYIPMSVHGLLSYIALAINYYYNSGVSGPTIFLYMVCFQLLIVITPRRQHLLWIALSFCVPIALLIYEYRYPYEIVFSYKNRFDRFADIIFSFSISVFFIYYITIRLRTQFENEKQQVKDHANVIESQMEELMQSEAKLGAFFQSTENVYVLLDDKMNLLAFNEVAKDVLRGFGKLPLLHGENVFSYISETLRNFFFQKLNSALKGEMIEFEFHSKNKGYDRWWNIQLNPVFTSTGHVMGIACTAVNINERKKQEQRILAKNEALMKIAHYQSHDLRGPVTSIIGLINILMEEKENAPEECYILLEKAVNSLDYKIHKVIDLTDTLGD